MNNQMCDKLFDYFNETMTADEKRQFEAHLESCPECYAELQELTALTDDLPYLSEPIEPPKEMKQRILGNVLNAEPVKRDLEPVPLNEKTPGKSEEKVVPITSEKRPNKFILPSVAALLFVSLLGNGYFLTQKTDEPQKEIVLDDLKKQVALAPVDEQMNDVTAMASLMKIDSREMVVLQAEQLKQLNDGEVYQIWLIENKKPVAAGSFVPDSSGDGAVMYEMNSEDEVNWDTIAITIEPKAGNEAPEGDVILASQL